MSTEPDKRCGTCKFWLGDADTEIHFCVAEVPDSVLVEQRNEMRPDEGTDCPCWESKQ